MDTSGIVFSFDGTDHTANLSVKTDSEIEYSTGALSTGTHQVSLTVPDTAGNTDTFQWSFTVPNQVGNRIWDAEEGHSLDYTWDYTSFGGFFYSFTSGLGTEEMTMHLDSDTDRSIEQGDLVYKTQSDSVAFDRSAWGEYYVAGFMGEKYFAGYSSSIGKDVFGVDKSLMDRGRLSKVLMDTDDGTNLYVGEELELEQNYYFRITEIDINGKKAMVELYKSGALVDDTILDAGDTYVYEKDVGGLSDVPVIAVHIDDVFRGTEESIVTTDGVFQIADKTKSVESGQDFDEMEVTSTSSSSITLKNRNDLSLGKGDTVPVFGSVQFEVADNATLRFAPVLDVSGERTVRGTVTDKSTYTWLPDNFEGFYYEIDSDIGTEQLSVTRSGRTVQENDLVYTSSTQNVEFQQDSWGTFSVIGFMAEKYFAGYTATTGFTDASSLLSEGQLAKVLIDSDDTKTVYQGSSLQLQEGYALRAVQVDTQGSSAMLELYKDGELVDGSTGIVETGDTFVYEKEVGTVDDVVVIAVHIDSVFRGGESSVLVIDGVFQISEDVATVESGQEFGEMEVASTTSSSLTMENRKDVSLKAGTTTAVMGDVEIRVADTGTVKFAPITMVADTVSEQGEAEADRPIKSLNVSATPREVRVGGVVEIVALSNASPVNGVAIKVNMDPVGNTDATGTVLYTPHTAGTFTVVAEREGYGEASTNFSVSRTELVVEKPNQVLRDQNFSLIVTDLAGDVVKGAEVRFDGELVGETDGDGRVRHRLVAAGVYSLSVSKEGYTDLVTDLRVQEPSELRILDIIAPVTVAGHPTEFKLVVTNPGTTRFNGTIVVKRGNESIDYVAVSLGPGETSTVTWTHTFESTVFGNPVETNPEVVFDGYEVRASVEPDTGRQTVLGGGIIAVIVGMVVVAGYFYGFDELRSRVQLEVRRVQRFVKSRIRGGRDEEEEVFIGMEDLDDGE